KKGVDVNREDKQRVVEDLHAAWLEVNTGIVTHYRGLSVADMGALRSSLRAAEVGLQVVKNTLAKRAAEGTDFSLAEDLFTGPVAVAYGNDPIALAKVLSDFARSNEALKILGGVLDGKRLEKADVAVLASLPSREVLLARVLGSMQSPLSGFVRTLHEVPASFVRALAGIRDQKQAA
ncbi:MAG: 50S ribosomal protein L10, partial [Mariprofundaceae bacterium]|nr:50S ribosomal protein L10 [Mariprofundaceae bacterium]